MIDDSDEVNSETREAILEHLEPVPEVREWLVRWEAGISASSPLEAACEAHRMMQDPSAMAPILEVFEEEPGDWEAEGTLVDLSEVETPEDEFDSMETGSTWVRPLAEYAAEYDLKLSAQEMIRQAYGAIDDARVASEEPTDPPDQSDIPMQHELADDEKYSDQLGQSDVLRLPDPLAALAPRVVPPMPSGWGLNAQVRCALCGTLRYPGQFCDVCRGRRREPASATLSHRPRRTPEARIRTGASRLGISVEEYRAHVEAGEKWCYGHKDWHPLAAFGPSGGWTGSGPTRPCLEWKRERERERDREKREAAHGGERWCAGHRSWEPHAAFDPGEVQTGPGGARCIAWQALFTRSMAGGRDV